MKKDKKKIIITSSLLILCVGILTGVYFVTRTPEKEFIPSAVEETEPQNAEWNENAPLPAEATIETKENTEAVNRQGTEKDNTQTVISEKDDETVTDLSGSQTNLAEPKEKPAAPPVTTDDTTDPQQEPSYDDTVPESSSDAPIDKPDAGSSNEHAGQVYDPVFGWVTPGVMEGHVTDNDGDINKMVGTMD